jgi:hypothetical protein
MKKSKLELELTYCAIAQLQDDIVFLQEKIVDLELSLDASLKEELRLRKIIDQVKSITR